MGERDISQIETPLEEATDTPVSKVRQPAAFVEVNYPEPTPLSQILADISHWSQECFAMDPAIDTKIQIFAPHPLEKQEAIDLFWASLSIVGLRAVRVGRVTKIVPVSGRIVA